MGGGGHTQQALDLATRVVREKVGAGPSSYLDAMFLADVLLATTDENAGASAYVATSTFNNGVRIVKYFDSACEHRDKKTIFPENWDQEAIVEAIRDCLPSREKAGFCLDCASLNRQFFVGNPNGVYVGVVVDTSSGKVVTAYPLDNQEPHFENGRQMLTIEDPASTSLTNARTIDVDVTDLN